jgi:hypothetical protein
MSLMQALVCVITLGFTSCDNNDEDKDMTYPKISSEGITANPIDCQVYQRGSVIPFHYIFTDDMELGAYNIEIHSNFDHHTHGTTSTDCEDGDEHEGEQEHEHEHEGGWHYNQDFAIPAGLRTYEARHDIVIPSDIEPGNYHFMVRLTDHAGWQQLHAVAIKIQ